MNSYDIYKDDIHYMKEIFSLMNINTASDSKTWET